MTDTSDVLVKAESTRKTATPSSKIKGQPRFDTLENLIKDSKVKELSVERRLTTFAAMLQDEAVYTAHSYTTALVVKELWKGKVHPSGDSEKSKIAADFLNYSLRNMKVGSWLQACWDMTTAGRCGWSSLNIVVKKRNEGQYKGSRCLHALSPRRQESVYAWLWNDDFTEWEGLVQKPPYTKNKSVNMMRTGMTNTNASKLDKDFTVIKASELLHISYDGTMNNPQGWSPFMACFEAWSEKKLIEKLELSGVSKDLSGVLVVKVPSELIEAANAGDEVAEEELRELQQDAADMHQGKTTHVLLTSDTDSKGTPLYDIELKGVVGGGGKNYSTSEVINQKRKSIYNCFGAGFLLLGQDGSGSFSLSSSQSTVHGNFVEKDIMTYTEAINTQLIPRLLAANGVYLNYEDMPVFKAGDPNKFSLDDIGKFIQRTKATGALTESIWEFIAEKSGLPTEGISDIDYLDSGSSRSGDGMKAGLNNSTATSPEALDTSSSNNDNGGVTKTAWKDPETGYVYEK